MNYYRPVDLGSVSDGQFRHAHENTGKYSNPEIQYIYTGYKS